MHLYHWQMNKLSHFDEETNNFNATNHSTGVKDTLIKHWANRQFNSVRWTNKYYLSFSQHKTSPTDTINPLPFRGKYKLGGGFKLVFCVHPNFFWKWFPFWSKHNFQLGWFNHHQLDNDDSAEIFRLRWRDFQSPGFAPKNPWKLNLWRLDRSWYRGSSGWLC